MRLTFCTETGQAYPVEVDAQMELENIMVLLEAEVLWLAFCPLITSPTEIKCLGLHLQSGISVSDQSISIDGRDLSDPKATISELGVGDNAVLLLRRKVVVAGR